MSRAAWMTLAVLAALTASAGLAADPPAKEAAPDPKVEAAVNEANARAGKMSLRERVTVRRNFKYIGLAVHNYESANITLPRDIVDKAGKPLLSWRVAVLPYLEQPQPIASFNLDEPWDSAHNAKVLADNPMPKEFAVPGVTPPNSRETHVQSFAGAGAWLAGVKPRKFADITDGLAGTACVALAAKAVPWTQPGDIAFDDQQPDELLKRLLAVRGGFPLLFADGAVATAKPDLTGKALAPLVTVAGGEVVDLREVLTK